MKETDSIIVLPDLEKKIQESIHDSIAHFGKKCPYCRENLFKGNIRNKIEIDHFVPISKGGQHVPWNILPVCSPCNRKKKDKEPQDFINLDLFQECKRHLDSIKEKFVGQVQQDLENLQIIKAIVQQVVDTPINHNAAVNIINKISLTVLNRPILDVKRAIHHLIIKKKDVEIVSFCIAKPKSGDLVEKMNPTEISDFIQNKTDYFIKPGILGRILKSMRIENKRMRHEGLVKHIYFITKKV